MNRHLAIRHRAVEALFGMDATMPGSLTDLRLLSQQYSPIRASPVRNLLDLFGLSVDMEPDCTLVVCDLFAVLSCIDASVPVSVTRARVDQLYHTLSAAFERRRAVQAVPPRCIELKAFLWEIVTEVRRRRCALPGSAFEGQLYVPYGLFDRVYNYAEWPAWIRGPDRGDDGAIDFSRLPSWTLFEHEPRSIVPLRGIVGTRPRRTDEEKGRRR